MRCSSFFGITLVIVHQCTKAIPQAIPHMPDEGAALIASSLTSKKSPHVGVLTCPTEQLDKKSQHDADTWILKTLQYFHSLLSMATPQGNLNLSPYSDDFQCCRKGSKFAFRSNQVHGLVIRTFASSLLAQGTFDISSLNPPG